MFREKLKKEFVKAVNNSGMSYQEIADRLGTRPQDIWRMTTDNEKVGGTSAEKYADRLTALGYKIDLIITPTSLSQQLSLFDNMN